ncbi:MAG TPA: hypothetical protein PKV67_18125, partial [Hyphomonas sp.]|nr:hypothetical protein [Hyphomonas sp.]
LPQGMTLSSVGVLSGKPTAKNEVGASFEIQASYKGANGGQVYTIVVGDATLSVSQIGAGYYHTCAITTDEKVKCWGRNDFGQLGNEATTNSNLPVDVRNLPGRAVSIDVGGVHACALMETKELYCWGGNGSGQLGDGTTNNRSKPVRAGTLSNIVQFAAGENHTCAVTGLGAAHCWGNNAVGQIGTGLSGANSVTPYAVGGLSSGVRMIAAGAQNSCVVMTDGTAKCWGAGIANASLDSYLKAAPSDVKLANNTKLTSVKKIDIGHSHVCAVLTSGSAKCWGNTSEYPIGNATFGQFSPALYAADVIGLPEAIDDIDVGFTHSCAKTVSGKMLCWGSNRNGQLGRTISGSATAAPGYVAELNEVVIAISAGRDQTCATLDNGKVMCWGANGNGQVGDGSFTQRNRPVNVKP